MQGVEERWGEGSRPIVLALSNPSEVAECTAQQAHDWSGGRAVYASGTAFPPFDTKDGRKVPAQANNSLIFPGIISHLGAGAMLTADRMHVSTTSFLSCNLLLFPVMQSEYICNQM